MNTSAEARVVASFTFIVVLLLGAWGALDNLLASSLMEESEFARLFIALLPFAATGVAFQAANAAEGAWARTLGGARDARHPQQPGRGDLLPREHVNCFRGAPEAP